MIDPKIHIGETHGIFYILDVLPEKDKYGHWVYDCVCTKCGFHRYSHYGAIAGEKSIINTCKHLGANGEYIVYGYKWSNKRIGNIFSGMKTRCYNKDDKSYRWYGAKGVKICDEWLNNPKLFEEWSLSNGYADNLTIDRLKSDQDYSPSNCRWIPLKENAKRAGNVNWITVNEETLTGRDWSKKLGLGLLTIDRYIKTYGYDLTKCLIEKMVDDPKENYYRKPNQTWFDVYGIK